MYIHRAIEDTVVSVSDSFPVLLLTGPRQVGKTTLLEHLASEGRKLVSLDDLALRKLAKSDPALFLQRFKPPLIIDEVQYAPELLPYIKLEVDRSKQKGSYWLTGSQSFHLMKGISESLAGRVGILDLLGLSENEIRKTSSLPFTVDPEVLTVRSETLKPRSVAEVFQSIFTGSMPALYTDNAPDRDIYYESYVRTYIQRDVRDLTQVADELEFQTFMTVVAARTARPIQFSEIAGEVGVSAPTIKKWLSILQASQLITLVQPYHNNLLKRATKMPLLHFLDTGLAAYLLGWDSPETLERGAMSGQFFESYTFGELYKSYINAGKNPPLYYYRDKEKREIDVLLYQNATLTPIEIKKTAAPGKDSLKNFSSLNAFTGTQGEKAGVTVGEGCVICMAETVLPLDKHNWQVPVWTI